MTDTAKVASWIAGLMAENYEAVGFIPEPAVERQYLWQQRYILQANERGRPVGYLLHGVMSYGRTMSIAQHCIQVDSRLKGYGEATVSELVSRAERAGVAAITARCATDLPSLTFWLDQGFVVRNIAPGGNRRGRHIACIWLPLTLPLLETQT